MNARGSPGGRAIARTHKCGLLQCQAFCIAENQVQHLTRMLEEERLLARVRSSLRE